MSYPSDTVLGNLSYLAEKRTQLDQSRLLCLGELLDRAPTDGEGETDYSALYTLLKDGETYFALSHVMGDDLPYTDDLDLTHKAVALMKSPKADGVFLRLVDTFPTVRECPASSYEASILSVTDGGADFALVPWSRDGEPILSVLTALQKARLVGLADYPAEDGTAFLLCGRTETFPDDADTLLLFLTEQKTLTQLTACLDGLGVTVRFHTLPGGTLLHLTGEEQRIRRLYWLCRACPTVQVLAMIAHKENI